MRVIRGIGAGAAAALITICLAGCPGHDAESAAGSAGRDIGHHADVHPAPGIVRPAINALSDAEIFKQVGEDISEANENTKGPTRDALIAAACDSFQQGNYSQDAYTTNLEHELANDVSPPTKQVLDTVNSLASTLYQDAEQGSSAKATVAVWCTANAVHSQVAG